LTVHDHRQLGWLLAEICTTYGFCAANRDPRHFDKYVSLGADAFVSEVFEVEGMDPQSHRQLYTQLRELVAQRFARSAPTPSP